MRRDRLVPCCLALLTAAALIDPAAISGTSRNATVAKLGAFEGACPNGAVSI
jgi:hypothetical protein